MVRRAFSAAGSASGGTGKTRDELRCSSHPTPLCLGMACVTSSPESARRPTRRTPHTRPSDQARRASRTSSRREVGERSPDRSPSYPASTAGLAIVTVAATHRSHTVAVTASRESLRARHAYPSFGRLRPRHTARPSLWGISVKTVDVASVRGETVGRAPRLPDRPGSSRPRRRRPACPRGARRRLPLPLLVRGVRPQ
jgi:hypothetical protein